MKDWISRLDSILQLNGRELHPINKDFPLGQVNGFETTWTLKKLKTWDRLKNNTAVPSHF